MIFAEALKTMKGGRGVKLPSWGGYWWWDEESQIILMYTKDGGCMDIRETQNVEYTIQNILSDEWIVADGQNCPILGGEAAFSFGEAIKYLKRGIKVARKGWNGKNQYIQLATDISYKTAAGRIINCEHEAIGNKAIWVLKRALQKKQQMNPRKNWKDMLPKKPMTQPNSSESSWKQQ